MIDRDAWTVAAERLSDLQPFIDYLKATRPEDWLLDRVRSKDNTQNCLFGHLVNWYYGKDYQGDCGAAWDTFEEMWATTYMVYPVNDGQNPKYQQPTARERVVAYLEDLRDGKERTTRDWDRYYSEQYRTELV